MVEKIKERNEAEGFLNSFKLSLKELKQEVLGKPEKNGKSKVQEREAKLYNECREKYTYIHTFISENGEKEKATENGVEFQYKIEFDVEGKHVILRNKYYNNRGTEIEMIEESNGKQEFLKLKQDKVHADYDIFSGGGTGYKTDISNVRRGGNAEKTILDKFMDKIQKYGK